MWFTNSFASSIGRITTDGQIATFTDDRILGRVTPDGEITTMTDDWLDGPRGITSGPDGGVSFTNFFGYSIGRVQAVGAPAP